MNLTPILALTAEEAEFAHSHSVMDALPHLGGMLMVLITLTILWGLTVLISKVVAIIQQKPAAPAKPAAVVPATAAAPAESDAIAPEVVIAIAAAVASVACGHRIISIKPMSSSWEKAGRQSVLTSHRIR